MIARNFPSAKIQTGTFKNLTSASRAPDLYAAICIEPPEVPE